MASSEERLADLQAAIAKAEAAGGVASYTDEAGVTVQRDLGWLRDQEQYLLRRVNRSRRGRFTAASFRDD